MHPNAVPDVHLRTQQPLPTNQLTPQVYGETALVKDHGSNGRITVTVVTGPHKGENKSVTSNFLRPEDYDLEAEESTNSGQSGVRTTSVTTQSFVELQVLKQKDWRLLIQNDTNPDFLQVLEFVADTRKKASKNAQRKKHTKHGLQGSEQWAVEDDLAALAFSKMETKSTRSALSLASLVRNSNFIKSPLSPVTSST